MNLIKVVLLKMTERTLKPGKNTLVGVLSLKSDLKKGLRAKGSNEIYTSRLPSFSLQSQVGVPKFEHLLCDKNV